VTADELEPFFDPVSYGRALAERGRSLSIGQIKLITRTVGRTPEVMVKVVNKGSSSAAGVGGHVGYIGRRGAVELETDEGEILQGPDVGKALLDDWNLDLIQQRGKINLTPNKPKQPPRLVYKLIFSMPAGTPPEKVQAAVRNFAREEFALKHRYVMALHTDEPHPHVHLVLKARSEEGQRLYVRKATLRQWREGFASHLRALGVTANATPRYVRGETRPRKSDGIYRAMSRGESTHFRKRVEAVHGELVKGKLQVESGKAKLLHTREEVRRGWLAMSDELTRQGHPEIAVQVERYVQQMPKPLTEKERIATKLLERARKPRVRELEMTR
jgi:type IV secretory pathway VirD2 relaxase